MIDVFAAFSLLTAASRTENPAQLFSDAEKLYGVYADGKAGNLNIEHLAQSGGLKPIIEAAARVAEVGAKLADDPQQMKNIAALLQSI